MQCHISACIFPRYSYTQSHVRDVTWLPHHFLSRHCIDCHSHAQVQTILCRDHERESLFVREDTLEVPLFEWHHHHILSVKQLSLLMMLFSCHHFIYSWRWTWKMRDERERKTKQLSFSSLKVEADFHHHLQCPSCLAIECISWSGTRIESLRPVMFPCSHSLLLSWIADNVSLFGRHEGYFVSTLSSFHRRFLYIPWLCWVDCL